MGFWKSGPVRAIHKLREKRKRGSVKYAEPQQLEPTLTLVQTVEDASATIDKMRRGYAAAYELANKWGIQVNWDDEGIFDLLDRMRNLDELSSANAITPQRKSKLQVYTSGLSGIHELNPEKWEPQEVNVQMPTSLQYGVRDQKDLLLMDMLKFNNIKYDSIDPQFKESAMLLSRLKGMNSNEGTAWGDYSLNDIYNGNSTMDSLLMSAIQASGLQDYSLNSLTGEDWKAIYNNYLGKTEPVLVLSYAQAKRNRKK